jgi:hypothetical protein
MEQHLPLSVRNISAPEAVTVTIAVAHLIKEFLEECRLLGCDAAELL